MYHGFLGRYNCTMVYHGTTDYHGTNVYVECLYAFQLYVKYSFLWMPGPANYERIYVHKGFTEKPFS
jgi:hypothetical protein